MKRVVALALLLVATLIGGSTVSAHNANPTIEQWDNAMNQPSYWGGNCIKWDAEDSPPVYPAIYTVYKTIVKGGQWVNIYNRAANPPHVHGFLHGERKNFGISWTTICLKKVQPTPTPTPPPTEPPKGPDASAVVKILGPKGDPWYRFVMKNTGDTPVTCVAHFEGRNGHRTVSRRLAPDTGFRSAWMWVRGNTRIVASCWSGGERIFRVVKRSAPPGYYGPLWFGYNRGYFPL